MGRSFLYVAVLLLSATTTLAAGGQQGGNIGPVSADGIWQQIDDWNLKHRQSQRPIIPQKYKTFQLDLDKLRSLLSRAPLETTEGRGPMVLLTIPLPDGSFQQFRIERSPVAEAGLIAKYPELGETYRAQGVDEPSSTMRFDLLPSGFHAMILSLHGTILIDPYATGDRVHYLSYNKSDLSPAGREWVCGVVDQLSANVPEGASPSPEVTIGPQLRTYRLALAADNEYAIAVGGNTVSGTLAAEVLVMNRVNGVYERDLDIHMNIVANNNLITFASNLVSSLCGGGACNAGNDPYTNNSGSTMLGQNQFACDSAIGSANYDVGHVFSTGGGGIANLGVPCGSSKAGGVTGQPNPVGDPFAIDFVAHEMGHQFGANHTYNGIVGTCGNNTRVAAAAYEPGSGITIMAYAGICGNQNLADHSIDTMHVKSIEEIVAYTQAGNGNTCAQSTASGNSPPSVAVVGGPGFNIPKQTPFTLTAAGSDVNGDTVTYSWEEYDLGPPTVSVPNTDAGTAMPILRPFLPTLSSSRTFPALTHILNSANVPPDTTDGSLTGELLPQISRVMSFQVVARDNRASTGGINTANATVIVAASGPFAVTSPNTGVSYPGNSNQTVTWDVAGSNASPVSTANVKISLSTDGGNSFPNTLLASTPNDGAEQVTIPNLPSTTARIKIEAVGNIFFDISNTNFTITPAVVINRRVFDFDGDGRTDDAVVRMVSGGEIWYLQRSTAGFTGVGWGLANDTPVPGDYDGDGKWDLAVYRPGAQSYFYILRSADNTVASIPFGTNGDDPRVSQDFDGDGKCDPAVTRNVGSNLTFYILRSSLGFTGASFGAAASDVGIRGDFDGDGKADIAVYRSSSGVPANTFFVLPSGGGPVRSQSFGVFTSDFILPADFDGDGKTDYAVWRGSGSGTPGIWYWLRSSDGGFAGQQFGSGGVDRPVPGDYDGDGKTDLAVWRPGSQGVFYHLGAVSGFTQAPFGTTGDTIPAFSLQAR